MEDAVDQPLPAEAADAACDREEVRERVAQDVDKLLCQLGEDLQAQLLDLHGRVLVDLQCENKALRTRLAAADYALLQAGVLDVVPDGEEQASSLALEPCGELAAAQEPKLSQQEADGTTHAPLMMSVEISPPLDCKPDEQFEPWSPGGSIDGGSGEECHAAGIGGGERFHDDQEEQHKPHMDSVQTRSSLLWTQWESASDGPQSALARAVRSSIFEGFISSVIMCNCASMGFDAHSQVVDHFDPTFRKVLDVAEHVFTAIFLLEFLARCKVFGWQYYKPDTVEKRWNFMDACLVFFTGVLFTWLVPLIQFFLGSGKDNPILQTLSVLRAARLARLVRVAQKVPLFKEAWMLIRGLGDSMRTLFWTCVVICFVTYVFAIFGAVTMVRDLKEELANLEVSGQDEERRVELEGVLELMVGVDSLMYTLIQVLMGDSFHSIMRPILYYIGWSWLYFYAYIAVAVFVLMNLVTAIIVDNALSTSRSDEDAEVKQKEDDKARDLHELKQLFTLMDTDGSGTLSWSEFKNSFADDEMARKWMLLDFQPEECKELFFLLDDGDGEIETDEFFDGLGRMKGVAQSKDIFRVQKRLDAIARNLGAVSALMTPAASMMLHNMSALPSGVSLKEGRAYSSSPRSP